MANLHESMVLTEAIIWAELEPFRAWNGYLAIETENPIEAITDIIKAANPHQMWDVADWCSRAKIMDCHLGITKTIYFPGFRLAIEDAA
jgi:hypothetical protein